MSLPRIVGLTGYARHGKDSVAEVLVKYGYERYALADSMKQALLVLDPYVIGNPDEKGKAEGPDGFWRPIRLSKLVRHKRWEGAKKEPEVRRLLQVFGTEVGRSMLGEDVWIEALVKSVPNFYSDHGPRVVISDVRFLNEARFIRRCRGEVWKVVRPDFDNGVGVTHSSEREIAQIREDELFTNDLDLEYLQGSVRRYITARELHGFGPTRDKYSAGEFAEFA